MEIQRYSVNQEHIGTILSWIPKEIAIPEIQRPFVWNSTKVRNLIDSLYQGYPIGYIILWKNPSAKIKEGKNSEGKKILIDGQQRITALMTSLLGHEILDSDYKRQIIKISFNPITEKFEVQNPAILKDISWISDIGPIIREDLGLIDTVNNYCESNPNVEKRKIEKSIQNLRGLVKKQIGIIELAHDLPIEVITEIFVRINSEGVKLNQADFVMSKIASNDRFGGSLLRKCIDYSCRLMRYPEFFNKIKEIDEEFYQSEYYNKLTWLKNENDGLYDPDYNDMLRVAFTSEFNRGKLSDLVSLLSGRNFETRAYEEKITKETFETLKEGVFNFINETNFKRFIMIIKSAGFISSDLIRSQNALNFAYIVYLKLKSVGYNSAEIEKYVRKWFVLSVLTERYSSSPESQFDSDIKSINSKKFNDFLNETEQAELSEAYWNVALVQNLESTSSNSPYFNIFLASQVKENDKGFLSKDISIKELIENRGDIHHIFPKEYLKTNNKRRGDYNQIANYVYMQSEINITIGKKSPKEYFKELINQCKGHKLKYGAITEIKELHKNLSVNCIPESIFDLEVKDYEQFLIERRILIAKKIKEYYLLL